MISNSISGNASVLYLSSHHAPFLFHLPLSVLIPLHSDGEVPWEVAEHTFLTESLFKLNLNDPLSS